MWNGVESKEYWKIVQVHNSQYRPSNFDLTRLMFAYILSWSESVLGMPFDQLRAIPLPDSGWHPSYEVYSMDF
jgi:hypothetical protein